MVTQWLSYMSQFALGNLHNLLVEENILSLSNNGWRLDDYLPSTGMRYRRTCKKIDIRAEKRRKYGNDFFHVSVPLLPWSEPPSFLARAIGLLVSILSTLQCMLNTAVSIHCFAQNAARGPNFDFTQSENESPSMDYKDLSDLAHLLPQFLLLASLALPEPHQLFAFPWFHHACSILGPLPWLFPLLEHSSSVFHMARSCSSLSLLLKDNLPINPNLTILINQWLSWLPLPSTLHSPLPVNFFLFPQDMCHLPIYFKKLYWLLSICFPWTHENSSHCFVYWGIQNA